VEESTLVPISESNRPNAEILAAYPSVRGGRIMKTRVPETITCINCNHNIIIKLYKVDTTINSSQGHFYTLHNPTEPAYTVYCINCGHFMTNDPDHAPAKRGAKVKSARRVPAPPAHTPREKKTLVAPVRKKTAKPAAAAGTGTGKPAAKTLQPPTIKTSPPKEKRSQRKKAK